MKKTLFTGSGVAIVTPFDPNDRLNETKLRELIDFQLNNGTDAIIICGTTGESSTLTHQEHVDAIRIAVEQTAGRVPVIAGTGSNDTAYGAELSKEAENLGADALLQVTPYYNKTSQKGLVKHFCAIADSTNLPVILYNVPSRTGVNIQPETYLELSGHPKIVATKEAGGNFSQIAKTLHLCGDALDVYSGNDDQILPLLALGAKGVISVLANVAPRQTSDICRLFFAGKTSESVKRQIDLMDLIDALFIEVNPIPVKTAMNLLGFEVGALRLPLTDMDEKNRTILVQALKKHGLLK